MSSSSSSDVRLAPAEVDAAGEIRAVVVDGEDVGSVWLELRDRTLHLHALLLEPAFRGRGVGSRVLRRRLG